MTSKHLLISVLINFGLIHSNCAQCIKKYDSTLHSVIYTKVDVMPEFPGGIDGWRRYAERNMHLPDNFMEGDDCGVQLTYQYSLIVEQDGSLSNITIRDKKDTLQFCSGDKALYYLLKGSPRWNIGKCNNKAVAVKMKMVFIMDVQ